MKGRFGLDVVFTEHAAVFQLFPSKNNSLLVWRNAFLVLDFRLDVVDRVRGLDFQRDRFARHFL